jgi:hypothetical protein
MADAPSVDDIPEASLLHAQLDRLTQAISLLGMAGANVPTLTINPPPPSPPPDIVDVNVPRGGGMLPAPVTLTVNPPVAHPDTLAALAVELQEQADAITVQLAAMGYTASGRA